MLAKPHSLSLDYSILFHFETMSVGSCVYMILFAVQIQKWWMMWFVYSLSEVCYGSCTPLPSFTSCRGNRSSAAIALRKDTKRTVPFTKGSVNRILRFWFLIPNGTLKTNKKTKTDDCLQAINLSVFFVRLPRSLPTVTYYFFTSPPSASSADRQIHFLPTE